MGEVPWFNFESVLQGLCLSPEINKHTGWVGRTILAPRLLLLDAMILTEIDERFWMLSTNWFIFRKRTLWFQDHWEGKSLRHRPCFKIGVDLIGCRRFSEWHVLFVHWGIDLPTDSRSVRTFAVRWVLIDVRVQTQISKHSSRLDHCSSSDELIESRIGLLVSVGLWERDVALSGWTYIHNRY